MPKTIEYVFKSDSPSEVCCQHEKYMNGKARIAYPVFYKDVPQNI